MYDEDKYFDVPGLLDEALKTEPNFLLSENFAEAMAGKMEQRFAWRQYIREFAVYLGAIVGIVSAWVALWLLWFGADWRVWLDFALSNAVLVAGTSFLLLFVLFADRVLLRYFLHRVAGNR